MLMKTALLVIDIQQALIDEHPANEELFLKRVDELIQAAHASGKEVIYVRHDGGAGDLLEQGSPGWRLNRSLSPSVQERIFEKRYPSSFKDTGLKDYLLERGIQRLVICGMQTEYCIDATIKSAFERGFSAVVPEGAHATYDAPEMAATSICALFERIWNHRYAEVTSLQAAVDALKE